MSYQVLARKWRPKSFRDTVGQEHVLQALINALDHDRLHHAYLFTGTRGVGKTTIARILAKCLNCDRGVSSEPCGECGSCTEIAEGRSVDLWEIDAASRTKVEDTRDLLDNVQYLPTRSRFKIYLIDEVHMLSTSSFNALLKTLEEPPEHVKFLLATTDPQKLPATVLSRCLQFNLKNMLPEQIVGHLEQVLQQELVKYDLPALWLLARAAEGSMRDALSLTDQAIAFGSGKLLEPDVRSMLGSVELGFIFQLIEAAVEGSAAGALAVIEHMAQHAPNFEAALDESISLLHRIAIAQAVPQAVDNSFGDGERLLKLAENITQEDAQLFYQVAITGKRDLSLASDPRSGFEMIVLRMIAFRPAAILDTHLTAADVQLQPQLESVAREVDSGAKKPREAPALPAHDAAQLTTESAAEPAKPNFSKKVFETSQQTSASTQVAKVIKPDAVGNVADFALLTQTSWPDMLERLGLQGIVYNIASNCEVTAITGRHVDFRLDQTSASLFNERHIEQIRLALENFFGPGLSTSIVPGEIATETPTMIATRRAARLQQDTVLALEEDPLLRQLIERFDGELDHASIVPFEQ